MNTINVQNRSMAKNRFALILRTRERQSGLEFSADQISKALASKLGRLGMKVTYSAPDSRKDALSTVSQFLSNRIPDGSLVTLFFFGHCCLYEDLEYWLPRVSNTSLSSQKLASASVSLSDIASAFSNVRNSTFLVCTDLRLSSTKGVTNSRIKVDPFVALKRADNGVISIHSAHIDEYAESYVMVRELLQQLERPDRHLGELLLSTKNNVFESTKRQQKPYITGYVKPTLTLTESKVEPIGEGSLKRYSVKLLGIPENGVAYIDNNLVSGDSFSSTTSNQFSKVSVRVVCPSFQIYEFDLTIVPNELVIHQVKLTPVNVPVPMVRIRRKSFPALTNYLNNLAYLNAGRFLMGSMSGDIDERPVTMQKVTGFNLGKTPVTVSVWREYCEANGYDMPSEPAWGWLDNHPIVNVSFSDIVTSGNKLSFCDWVHSISNVKVSVPTEIQWEYAARMGNPFNEYPWGDVFDRRKLWCSQNIFGDRNQTASVYRTANRYANDLGITDLAGNVWEWCSDWFDSYDSRLRRTQSDKPKLIKSVRGGSWSNQSKETFRCSYRSALEPIERNTQTGFRLTSEKN